MSNKWGVQPSKNHFWFVVRRVAKMRIKRMSGRRFNTWSWWVYLAYHQMGGVPKMVVPQKPSGFSTKNDHFRVIWVYHHLRKHRNYHPPAWFLNCWFGLGPGGLDSDWIPENERDCYLWVHLEFQTTNPNHQFTITWKPNFKILNHGYLMICI